ncbi:NAD(P)/FAD-dependent oxidoreductase [Pontivivens insulae]|uniref:Ferredoxin--NADP reductase n=1 Tax=Pontivivens insulae TaxID=1639689 RepID=A0A2R8A6N6_9RHOB|nr:NAD(P)/FAD-dependent oxidoreductase [Pontivivens insulae]RED17977.1 hypothetical protein DFR53_0165 [Pontivivens insulae]SPF27866.1 Ferredoxin--NADP reductase [Pontivivens insulae]
MTEEADVVIIGAGAAGLFCGLHTARRGRSVVVLDHAKKPGEKIRISGGGRCNFTNLHTAPENFLSANKRFAVSALKRYTQFDFIEMVDAAGIAWHEKTLGQLFCDGSAREIVDMLVNGLAEAGGQLRLSETIERVERKDQRFQVTTQNGQIACEKLVIATGGKSIPKMGATGFGYQIAEQFDVPVTQVRAGLVPLTFTDQDLDMFRQMAGLSVDARVSGGETSFREGLLFTHRGLSGPSILQISSYWAEGEAICVDLLPQTDLAKDLKTRKRAHGRVGVATALAEHLPKKLATALVGAETRNLADLKDSEIDRLSAALHNWSLKPAGTEGYRTAEVTLGGVSTEALDSRTMEVRNQPGLHFIGEVVDVTGWLGGYNFQWAWSSGWAAAQAL